jgi:hypothetical protein
LTDLDQALKRHFDAVFAPAGALGLSACAS